MLQVLCITSGTLKIAQTYSWLLCLFIKQWVVVVILGFYFDVFMMFIYTLHCINFDHGFRIKHL